MSTSQISGSRRVMTAAFAACLAGGAAVMAFGAGATTAPSARPDPVTSAASAPQALTRSVPTRLSIERLGLSAKVVELRAAADGRTLALPPLKQTGWDVASPTPGEAGVSVITGFISREAKKPGALHGLGRLREGDVVSVLREDDSTVAFRVTAIDFYPQGEFPAATVFPQTPRPELRLISTGGALHRGDPPGNAVVTAVAE